MRISNKHKTSTVKSDEACLHNTSRRKLFYLSEIAQQHDLAE